MIYLMLGLAPHGLDLGFFGLALLGLGLHIKNTNKKNFKYFGHWPFLLLIVSFWFLSLILGCFDLKFLPKIPYCVYWVRLRFEPQIRSTRFAMNFLIIIATT